MYSTTIYFFIDQDECSITGMCANGNCVNGDGSFTCRCHPGYTLSPTRQSCIGKYFSKNSWLHNDKTEVYFLFFKHLHARKEFWLVKCNFEKLFQFNEHKILSLRITSSLLCKFIFIWVYIFIWVTIPEFSNILLNSE